MPNQGAFCIKGRIVKSPPEHGQGREGAGPLPAEGRTVRKVGWGASPGLLFQAVSLEAASPLSGFCLPRAWAPGRAPPPPASFVLSAPRPPLQAAVSASALSPLALLRPCLGPRGPAFALPSWQCRGPAPKDPPALILCTGSHPGPKRDPHPSDLQKGSRCGLRVSGSEPLLVQLLSPSACWLHTQSLHLALHGFLGLSLAHAASKPRGFQLRAGAAGSVYLKWGARVSPRLAPTEPGRTKAGKLTWNQRNDFSRLTSGERDIQLPQQSCVFPGVCGFSVTMGSRRRRGHVVCWGPSALMIAASLSGRRRFLRLFVSCRS